MMSEPIESENMMDMPDYSVEVIIAIFQICKYEARPPSLSIIKRFKEDLQLAGVYA